jgi:ribonuclease BN (tRNA processing enzyme)
MLDRATDVHPFLTHFHLDHVCGLAYLPGIFAGRTLTIHAPAEALTGVDPERAVADLIRPPYNPRAWREIDSAKLSVTALVEGDNHVAGHVVRVRAQQHTPPSVAYRVDDRLVLATDTVFDPATADFARGAEVFLHEAWFDGIEEGDAAKQEQVRVLAAGHTSARRAAELARRAEVGELLLMHLNPFFDEGYYRQMEMSARDIFGSTSIYPDLYQRELMG